MNISQAISRLLEGGNLSTGQMYGLMTQMVDGRVSPVQLAGFLIALRGKGETVEEIVAAAQVLRDKAERIEVEGPHLIDTCGTGGDGLETFNVSTTAAFVVAAAGGRVAKHGNRSVSSRSGSADVLEAAGVNLDLSPRQVKQCIEEIGVGFLYAPRHHSALKQVATVRRELGVRTLFNLLGPLLNPANAPHQLLGVFGARYVEPLARALGQLGSQHVLVVHAEDGLDEISLAAPTRVAELVDGQVECYIIEPTQFGIEPASLEAIRVETVADSLKMMRSVLEGVPGPASDIVALNAGAAIYAADLSSSLLEGIEKARDVIAIGAGMEKLNALIEWSQSQ